MLSDTRNSTHLSKPLQTIFLGKIESLKLYTWDDGIFCWPGNVLNSVLSTCRRFSVQRNWNLHYLISVPVQANCQFALHIFYIKTPLNFTNWNFLIKNPFPIANRFPVSFLSKFRGSETSFPYNQSIFCLRIAPLKQNFKLWYFPEISIIQRVAKSSSLKGIIEH